jgi:neutral ceramidase
MLFKKIFRIVLVFVLTLIGALLIFVVFSVGPVDRTPASEQSYYGSMMNRLDSLQSLPGSKNGNSFSIGFSKVNLTPPFRTATAGYGNRRGKLFTSVHDSIYVRTMVIDNGSERVAIVSADLLIIPPAVTEALQSELASIGVDPAHVYLGATHTHNSIGNWGEGATRFIYGVYNESLVNFIAHTIALSIAQASQNILPAKLSTGAIDIPEAVENRLVKNGPEDSRLRVLQAERSDGKHLLLMSFTAHATCLFSRDLELSRDYPGVLVDRIEKNGYDFAMFMAGAVASHKPHTDGAEEWNCMDWMANTIAAKFLASRDSLHTIQDSALVITRVPLALGDPQVKISEDWKVRSWLFRAGFGEYPAYLTACRIGDVVMLGTPCDFSGEFDPALDSVAARYGMTMMVTSFNGGYMGYVTPEKYYDINHYETRLMNWYAPGTGEYMEKCLEKLIISVSE